MPLSISNVLKSPVGQAVSGLVGTAINPVLGSGINLANSLGSSGLLKPKAPAVASTQPAPASPVPNPMPATITAPAPAAPTPAITTQVPTNTSSSRGLLTFPGLVGTLANTAVGGSPEAQKYTKQTADYGAGNIDIGKRAEDILANYGKQIADIGGKGARFQAGQLTTGTSPVAEGNAAITAQTTAAQQQALAQGEQAALQGLGLELTGQSQAANAANQAAGQALTGQGQTLTGLGTAAGYAQPQLGSIGQVPFNPLAGNQGDILGTAQPGGVTAAGNLLGQFSGAQAAGAAPGNALANVVNTQTQQQAAYQSAHQQALNLQAQLTDLITTLGLNPSDLNAVNAGIQAIARQTSSPQYKILNNYLQDVASRYAQVLTPAGGSSTDLTKTIALGMLDGLSKGQSIIDVMNALDAQAKAVIAGVPTTGVQNQNASSNLFGW